MGLGVRGGGWNLGGMEWGVYVIEVFVRMVEDRGGGGEREEGNKGEEGLR